MKETAGLSQTERGAIGISVTVSAAKVGGKVHEVYNEGGQLLGAPCIIARQLNNAIVWRWNSTEAYGGSAPDQNLNGPGELAYNQRFLGEGSSEQVDCRLHLPQNSESGPSSLAGS